ncbi:MAG: hemerythrin [Holophagaceae bacterium]|nr:hemerythrin [Holophagaceae bacterium]
MVTPSQTRSPDGPESSTLTALLSCDHEEIDRLFDLAQTAPDVGPTGDACRALDRIWMRLAVHIRAEHKVVFPVLGETHLDLRPALQFLREDHDDFMASLAGVLKTLREPGPDLGSVRAVVAALKVRLESHNTFEEEGVYPLADQLPLAQLSSILRDVARELAFLPTRYGP